MMQFPCHGGPNQQWRLSATGTGPVLLVAAHSGKCAQADDDGAEAGDEFGSGTCDGRPAQQWTARLSGPPQPRKLHAFGAVAAASTASGTGRPGRRRSSNDSPAAPIDSAPATYQAIA